MKVTEAKYVISEFTELKTIKATIDKNLFIVPIEPKNIYFQAIEKWVEEGNKIEEAD